MALPEIAECLRAAAQSHGGSYNSGDTLGWLRAVLEIAMRCAKPLAARAIAKLLEMLKDVKWEDLPEAVKEHIKANPNLTVLQICALILPPMLAGPTLGLLGFSAIGPVAGSAAAAFQSAYGTIWGFSVLQSAAMGGFGASVVYGCTTAFSFAGMAAAEAFKTRGGGDHKPSKL